MSSSTEEAILEGTEPFRNGYHFPPKHPFKESSKVGLKAFWKFFLTPMGFFWTVYGLNVVAWGGMLFLLLCNASPAMCRLHDPNDPDPNTRIYDCDNIDSPRRIWVEIDSQVVNALFCVTGFGLAPWRFRDLYYLLKYRAFGKEQGIRHLAAIHRSWYRLPGSQDLPVDVGPDNLPPPDISRSSIPDPENKISDAPLTGVRAPPTAWWKLDFVIWTMVWNTFCQGALSGIMWGLNRYDRPSWTTGFLVALACIIAMVGGLVMFLEGKHVKAIEGVPCTQKDLEKLAEDEEKGIRHYNNIKDKKPKEEKKVESRKEKNRKLSEKN